MYGQIGSAGVRFSEVFVAPWLSAFPIAVGFFALALFAFLAAVYLAYAAPDAPLQEDFRKRALAAGAVVFVMAAVALVFGQLEAERIAIGITRTPIGILIQVATAAFAITALTALVKRRYRIARLAAGAQVSAILWGWAVAQFPFIVPETMPIASMAAPRATLVLLAVGLCVGAVILIPALRYLFRLFARPAQTV
jgi:cytochrome d ubiquinol oxidase subunit II